ncbi:MAG: hypothetical protein PHH43_00960 [Candidatus Cloacimonetes bacterium]|nr:hypothetical protein [Candidatus Cloacimonadota bacterium]MDD3234881.1 hypothetical protein [Candidatus Cloacimonadota bacterium]
MFKYLLSVCIFLCLSLPAWCLKTAQEAEIIAKEIGKEIQTDEPIFIDLRAGEWTDPLIQDLSIILLNRGADLRDNPQTLQNPDYSLEVADNGSEQINLKDYGIASAVLVQVNLNIKWQEKIEKSFFSYHNTRQPVYSFETKQIHLPEQRLIKISAFDFSRPDSPESEVSSLRLRWFEPLVAAAAIGSMIFLLWNYD